jgi:hypothetical protein
VKARNLSPPESFVKAGVWRDQKVATEASQPALKLMQISGSLGLADFA